MFMVVSSRDFVLLSYKKKEENITYGVARSIEYAPKPPIKGAVRADLKLGGWILEEVEGVTGLITQGNEVHLHHVGRPQREPPSFCR